MRKTPYQANNLVRVVSSMFSFAAARGLVPEGFNPTKGIVPFRGEARERLLSMDELERIGTALHLAETEGLPWHVDPAIPEERRKHVPKSAADKRTKIDAHAAAALRLLLLTVADCVRYSTSNGHMSISSVDCCSFRTRRQAGKLSS